MPIERLWINNRAVSCFGIIVSAISLIAVLAAAENGEKHRLANLRSTAPETYLLEISRTGPDSLVVSEATDLIRSTNPTLYLATIKGRASDDRYMSELKAIDPVAHTEELARREEEKRQRAIAEKKARADELAAMKEKLKNPPPMTDEESVIFYKRLAELEPNNREYARFRDNWVNLVERKRQKADAIRRPEQFIEVKKLSWSKEAFGSVMMVDVTLGNTAPIDIKDIELTCRHFAESGTRIDSSSRVIYQVVKANGSRRVNDFNMGFIHNQATSTSCEITAAVAVP
ncbi:hypothetical protein [Ancylobacter sp. FA202]|uniref:hypothetical protein n=1 Tax=Ancylobacter sp. FA202 TaxID=1111106 RepID=UPI000367CEBC|nr:hypothetical protein [Ancylobacter sp. FA202]